MNVIFLATPPRKSLLANIAINIASVERYSAVILDCERGAIVLEIPFDKATPDNQFSFYKTIECQTKRLSQKKPTRGCIRAILVDKLKGGVGEEAIRPMPTFDPTRSGMEQWAYNVKN